MARIVGPKISGLDPSFVVYRAPDEMAFANGRCRRAGEANLVELDFVDGAKEHSEHGGQWR